MAPFALRQLANSLSLSLPVSNGTSALNITVEPSESGYISIGHGRVTCYSTAVQFHGSNLPLIVAYTVAPAGYNSSYY